MRNRPVAAQIDHGAVPVHACKLLEAGSVIRECIRRLTQPLIFADTTDAEGAENAPLFAQFPKRLP